MKNTRSAAETRGVESTLDLSVGEEAMSFTRKAGAVSAIAAAGSSAAPRSAQSVVRSARDWISTTIESSLGIAESILSVRHAIGYPILHLPEANDSHRIT